MFNADLALSVTMAAISTVFSIVTLPANLLIYTHLAYGRDVITDLDWSSLFVSLAVVLSAIGVGLLCSAKVQSRRFNRTATQCGNLAGISLIMFSATSANTGSSDSKIWSRHFMSGSLCHVLGGLVLSNLLATAVHLRRPERVTVAIECCYQNVGIATSLALTMFAGEQVNEAMGVPFFYGVVEAVFVGFYCLGAWNRAGPRHSRRALLESHIHILRSLGNGAH
jgi:predicted Na+-dependent transporter